MGEFSKERLEPKDVPLAAEFMSRPPSADLKALVVFGVTQSSIERLRQRSRTKPFGQLPAHPGSQPIHDATSTVGYRRDAERGSFYANHAERFRPLAGHDEQVRVPEQREALLSAYPARKLAWNAQLRCQAPTVIEFRTVASHGQNQLPIYEASLAVRRRLDSSHGALAGRKSAKKKNAPGPRLAS